MKPDFAVIGAQKSASTFIQFCLDDHPDIFMPKGEISFFEDPEYSSDKMHVFENLFENRKESLKGFKRPNILSKTETCKRLYDCMPDAKFIVVLRHPVERAISAYYHYMNFGFLPVKNINFGMRSILYGTYLDKYTASSDILCYGLYYSHLVRFFEYFNRDQFCILFHDDIKFNPLCCIQRVYRFLNVNHFYVPKSINKKPQSVAYNLWRIRLLRIRNALIYKYDETKARVFKRNGVFGQFVSGALSVFDKFFFAQICKCEKQILDEDLHRKLSLFYKEDIDLLEKLLGVDLEHWKTSEIE